MKTVKEATWQGAGDPYNWDPVARNAVFKAAAERVREKQKAKGQPVPHKLETGRTLKSGPAPFRRGVKEDSHDAEGAAERVAKTKKHKKLHEVSAPGKEEWIKANKARFIAKYGKEKGTKILYAKAWKDSKANEARESEWQANAHLAGSVGKTAKGHYLMRGGRTLSGPHSPQDAVREYKKMSDSTGVKIVHVKESQQYDVTNTLLEASNKYKKAAEKAVSLAKKAKSNKHVDTKPTLDIADKGTTGPIEADTNGVEHAKI